MYIMTIMYHHDKSYSSTLRLVSHHIFTVYVFSSDAGAAVYYPPPTSATSLHATSVNSVTFFLTRSQEHQDSSIWSLLKYLRMEDDTFLVPSSLGVVGNIIEIGETLQQSVSQRCAHFAICMTFCHKHVFAVYSISHRVNLFIFLVDSPSLGGDTQRARSHRGRTRHCNLHRPWQRNIKQRLKF